MISITLLTLNAQQHLRTVLDSIQDFDEVLILDTGSTDKTLAIAREYANTSIYESPFEGFGPLHNKAASLCRNDWVLSLDADEVLSPSLQKEIASTSLNPRYAYSFPFQNYYRGKWIKSCGWYPDRHVRLYHRKQTQFTNAYVHEGIQIENLEGVIDFKNPVFHYSYSCTADFLLKMQRYSTLFAQQNKGRKKATTLTAIGHAAYAFFKSYFLQKGFSDGSEGFMISYYNANTAFYKYMKLKEVNEE